MCLLTFIRQGAYIDLEDLRAGAVMNSDGFGFAVHAGSSIITGKGMNFENVLEQFVSVRERHDGHALFHSRISTHGLTNQDNCHPFRVGGDNLTVLGHNGMLPIKIEKNDDRSDTAIFAEDYLPNLGGVYALDDNKVRKDLEKWAKGSKLVVLTADRHANHDYYILNEKDGHWDNGVWWSNHSYTYQPKVYTGWKSYITVDSPIHTANTPSDIYDDPYYGELWQVTCPVCTHNEVYDLNEDDPYECFACSSCMWCGNDITMCSCYDDGGQMVEPSCRKLSDKEMEDWGNGISIDVRHGNMFEESYDPYQM